ncbi:TRAP transporter large permease subunit [Chloroflexota bacterium]
MDTTAEMTEIAGFRGSILRIILFVVSVFNKLNPFVRGVSIAGMVIFLVMVCLAFIDVILRYVFDRPFAASTELTELMMVILVFSSIAYCQVGKAHVAMDIVIERVKPKTRLVMEGLGNILGIALFVVVIWQTSINALTTSESTIILNIPANYFAGLVPFGSTLLLLILFRDLLKNIAESLTINGKLWLLVIGLPILLVIVISYMVVARPIAFSLPVIGILGIVLLFLFFATGTPIAFVLMGLGFVLLSYIRGPIAGFEMISTSWYRTVASYSWSPLMFFMLMGYVCFYSLFGEDLFKTASRFLGHLPGGLAMGTVAACTAFGAVIGDNLSGSIAMTAIGLPEMKRYKYDEYMAIGTLTCAGTLGVLIPPSIGFILYAVLAEQSIGDLFMAGVIPGIICALMFMALIYIRCRINPSLGPPIPRTKWKERLISLKSGGPIGLLFLIVIGGIYAGAFTATEGGGIGAFGALALAFMMRRLNWKRFTSSLSESAKFTAMCFTLLGGAVIFGYFVAVSRIPYIMADFVAGLAVAPIIVLLVIIGIFFLLGCFIPAIPMVLLCVPIFVPIAITLDWDLVWFGVIVILMFNTASITPPFGINLFVMKGITNKPMGFVYRSVLPFVLSLAVTIAIIIAFPVLSTWLPYLLN